MKKLLRKLTGMTLACAIFFSTVPAVAMAPAEQAMPEFRDHVGALAGGMEDDIQPVFEADIASDAAPSFESNFKATDMQGNAHLSDPSADYGIRSFDEVTLGAILPEAYTGRPVKPRVRLICRGDEDLLLEGVDYTVTYSSNVEKGTGRVTVTSLMEGLPGTLTGTFTICGAEDIAEETAKLLPGHTLFAGCTDTPYEYMEHIFVLENLKYFYDCGLELSGESLAKMNGQYAAYEKLGTFRDSGVKVYSAFWALGYPSTDIKLSAKDPISSEKSKMVKTVKSIAAVEELLSCYEIGLRVKWENGSCVPSAILPGRGIALKLPLPRGCDVEALNGHLRAYVLTKNSSRPVEIGPEYICAAERNGERYVTVRTSQLGRVAVFRAKPPVFADVPEDSLSYDAVNWAVGKGDISVPKDESFLPNANWTRIQVVTFLWRAYGQPKPTMTENPFTDVDEFSPSYRAILWAVERGITYGTSPGLFEPMAPCTRAQAVTFLWRAAGRPNAPASGTFSDVAASKYYADAVAWAAEAGITNGTGAAAFEPNSACTRAQMVTFLYRDPA